MDEACRREVEELHRFFQEWFRAAIPAKAFSRFADVLASDFEIRPPSGTPLAREHLLDGLRKARGSDPDIRIWCEDISTRTIAEGAWVTTYRECQETASGRRDRISTAVFRAKEGNPNGLEWVRVHETWA